MNTVIPRPPKVEMDFTDAQLTGFGGWSVLGRIEEAQVETLLEVARSLAAQVAPAVVEHEAAVRG